MILLQRVNDITITIKLAENAVQDVAQGFSYDRNTVSLIKAANQPQRVRELLTFYVSPETYTGLELRITPLNGDIRIYNANLLISYNI